MGARYRRAPSHRAEVRVTRRRAVGNHCDWLACSVRRIHLDLDVEHGGQPAKPLRANTERVDLVVQFDAQSLDIGALAPRCLQLEHVDVVHQRFLGEQHGLFCSAADADAEHSRRTPSGAHRRHRGEHPVDDRIARIEHHEFALVLGAAPLGRDRDVDFVARHQLNVDNGGRVVAGVLAAELRRGRRSTRAEGCRDVL